MYLRMRYALLLAAPLFVFLLVTFLVPIGLSLARGFEDFDLTRTFPGTSAALTAWNGEGPPDPKTVAVFIDELQATRGKEQLAFVAERLNTDINGFRTVLLRTSRQLQPASGSGLEVLVAIDPHWSDRAYWAAMKRATGPLTSYFLLAALDFHRGDDGQIARVEPGRRIFQMVFARTLWIALVVTGFCLLLGYPVAYLIATARPRVANWLMFLVLVPFWTSVLVRTTGWIVLLQKTGLINVTLAKFGFISVPLDLIYNRVGVYIAMVHVLLPLMILPLYSVMKSIGPETMRAARSMGAPSLMAFRCVYVPQTRAGIAAGALLVFVSALGLYITPALIGGADDQMVSASILFYTNQTSNPGMAGALSLILLGLSGLVYLMFLAVEGRDLRKAH